MYPILNNRFGGVAMELQKLVRYMLDMGEILIRSGAEAIRVEDTLERIGKAYGCARVDVFTITTNIWITVHTLDQSVSQTRRIRGYVIDMEKVEKVNALSRAICSNPLPLEEVHDRIMQINQTSRYSEKTLLLAYLLVASSFTVFSGGTYMDGFASLIAALILRIVQRMGQRIRVNIILLNTLCAAVVGLVVMLMVSMGIGSQIDKIVIGNVMLLIPGLQLTGSLRDLINGDIITGLLGIVESILKAVAIALGFAILLLQIGG